MAAIRHLVTVPLALCSFIGVFYAIGKLMVFLSFPVKIPIHQVWIVNFLDDWSKIETALLPLTTDAILIVVFILPHSFLRSDIFKSLWQRIGLSSASRSIYNLVTAASLLVSINKNIININSLETTDFININANFHRFSTVFDKQMGASAIIDTVEFRCWIESNSILDILYLTFPRMGRHLRWKHCDGSAWIDWGETSMVFFSVKMHFGTVFMWNFVDRSTMIGIICCILCNINRRNLLPYMITSVIHHSLDFPWFCGSPTSWGKPISTLFSRKSL